MRCPTTKSLIKHFPHLDRKTANLIRRFAHATDDADKLRALVDKVPRTETYVRSMYSSPYLSHMWRTTVALHAIDRDPESKESCDRLVELGQATAEWRGL